MISLFLETMTETERRIIPCIGLESMPIGMFFVLWVA
jgi:hypothetical protein